MVGMIGTVQGHRKTFLKGGGGGGAFYLFRARPRGGILFKKVIFALISSLTLYIGSVKMCPPTLPKKRRGLGGGGDPVACVTGTSRSNLLNESLQPTGSPSSQVKALCRPLHRCRSGRDGALVGEDAGSHTLLPLLAPLTAVNV